MKITPKEKYPPDRYGCYDYPIGHIFNYNRQSYIVERDADRKACDLCGFYGGMDGCNIMRCGLSRKDGQPVIFKKI